MSDANAAPVLLSVPSIQGNEWQYVKDCLDSEWVSTAGSYVERFEKSVAEYVGAKHAVACVNGTAALQLALEVAGVRPDDEVIVPTITFMASVNAIAYNSAHPVFMDCDSYYNIDTAKTLEFLEKESVFKNGNSYNRKTGRRIAAIMPVHVFGNPVWLDALLPACRKTNIAVVEDAAESLGSQYIEGNYQGRFTGAIADAGCFSFNGNKIITTGGGGMLVTNRKAFADRARYLSTQAKDDPVRYVHNSIGYNFRLTNIQAAMGVAQMEQLDDYIAAKRDNYQKYQTAIAEIEGLHLASTPSYSAANHWFYALQIDAALYGRDREQLMQDLHQKGIQSRPLWLPNHRQKPFVDCQSYKLESADALWQNTLNIPCSVNLQEAQIERVIGELSR